MKRKSWSNATEEHLDSLMANSENISVKKVNIDSPSHSSAKKLNISLNRSESDRDSDYGGSDISESKGEVTTLKMLFEKCQASEQDFYESCLDIGLLNQTNTKCKQCNIDANIIEPRNNRIDGLQRKCDECHAVWSVKRDSWCENTLVSLKDLVLIIYCWCHGYAEKLTAHELDVDISTVSSVFIKCSSVPDTYYQNPISNLGGENKKIITDIFTFNNRTVLACMDKSNKNTFFSILKNDYDENTLLTLLIDNFERGSVIVVRDNSPITKILDQECLMYLLGTWDISFTTENNSTDSLILQWSELDLSLPPADNLDPTYKDYDVDSILKLALFKKRMENSKDSFLFFLTVVSQLFNNHESE